MMTKYSPVTNVLTDMQEPEDIIVCAQGKAKYFSLKLIWKILLHDMFWVLSVLL